MAASAGKGLSINPTNQSIEVETYFHVVAGGGAVEDGNVTVRIFHARFEQQTICFRVLLR